MLKTVRATAMSLAATVFAFGFGAGFGCSPAAAQTMGFATLPPGTLNHTTASAVAKVLKD